MRDQIENRPAVVLLVGLIIGLIAVAFPYTLLFLAAFLILVRPLPCRLMLACAFVVGLVLAPAPVRPLLESAPVHGVATIISVPRFVGSDIRSEVRFEGRTMVLLTPNRTQLMLGDDVALDGIVRPPSVQTAPIYSIQGIEGTVEASRVDAVRQGSWVAHLADGWRRSFIDFMSQCLSPNEAEMIDAICFNVGSLVDDTTKKEMERSGLIHVVTASGLQVLVFGFLVGAGVRFFPITRAMQLAILAAVLGFYCLAAGLNPAIVRASIMAMLGFSAYLVRREPDPLSALALAGIAYLIWSPVSVLNPGFQLSYIAVSCVCLFYQRSYKASIDSSNTFIRLTNEILRASAVVLFATLPLTAYYFGMVPATSILSNLLVCWCLPFLLGASFVSYFVFCLIPSVGSEIAVRFVSPIVAWIYLVIGWTGGDATAISVPVFSGFWLVAFYGAWALTYRRRVVQP